MLGEGFLCDQPYRFLPIGFETKTSFKNLVKKKHKIIKNQNIPGMLCYFWRYKLKNKTKLTVIY